MKNLDKLAMVLARIEDQKEMRAFLQAILTPAEQMAIPKRLEVVKMLKSGLPQRQIAKKLGVGIATVTRGAKEIKLKRFQNV